MNPFFALAMLVATQGATPPADTTLVSALIRAVDTSAAIGGKASLSGKTFLVDIDYFHALARRPNRASPPVLPPPASLAAPPVLPSNWKQYDQTRPTCPTAVDCNNLGIVRVMVAGVETQTDGRLVISGSFVYNRPSAAIVGSGRVPRGAGSTIGFRFFSATLEAAPAGWRIVDVSVAQAS